MARCPSCDNVSPEDASRCAQCATEICVTCQRCETGNPRLARFCCGCGGRLELPLTSNAVSFAKPEPRRITVLFSDLVGSSALARKLDPEEWHALLQRIHAACGAVVEKHYGYVAQYLGDGLLAYFGYPIAHEDAPRCAVAAGLELVSEVERIRLESRDRLGVRVGIHTGAVVVGNIGSRQNQEALALGETPNLAFRIQEVAPEGGVVMSGETHRLVQPFFACEAVGERQLKGFTEAVCLFRVLDQSGAQTRLEAASSARLTRLVGRARECAQITEHWRSVLAGAAVNVLLVGEAGIGKSRLIDWLKRERDEASRNCIEFRCSEPARASALHPARDCLRRLAEIEHGESPRSIKTKLRGLLGAEGLSEQAVTLVATLLGVPLDESDALPAAQQRAALLDALACWLVGAPGGGPRLIIVEDVHWADPSTLELLSALLQRASASGSLLIMSARPEFAGAWLAEGKLERLVLERLSIEQTRELIYDVAKNKQLPEPIVVQVAKRAEGIPLFLEEITKAVLETGIVRETTDAYVPRSSEPAPAIPESLVDSLMGRLDRLGHSKPMAQVAALLGRDFNFSLFEAVWQSLRSVPNVNPAIGLERLVSAQLLTRQGEPPTAVYQFRHALMQDAGCESLLRSVRRDYHKNIAGVLLESFPARAELEPELVAHHLRAAQIHDQASRYFGLAAQRALASSAHAEAIAHFNSSLEELMVLAAGPERSRRELDLRSRLGVALITTRGFASREVEETYSRAAELSNELEDELPLKVLYGIWVVNLVRSDAISTERMVPNLERLALAPRDAAGSLVVNSMLGAWAFFDADYPKAVKHCVEASSFWGQDDPKALNDAVLSEHGFEGGLYPLLYLAWTRAMTGDVDEAWSAWQRASDLAAGIGDPYTTVGVLAFGAALHHDIGDLRAAGELARQMRELSQDKGFVLWLSIAITISGNALLGENKIDEAVETAQQGLDLMSAVGAQNIYPYYSTYLAEALLARGDSVRAIELLQRSLELSRRNTDKFCQPELMRLLGEAQLQSGAVDEAQRNLEAALKLAQRHGGKLYELRAARSIVRALSRDEDHALRDREGERTTPLAAGEGKTARGNEEFVRGL